MLVNFEREHARLQERNEELEMNIKQMRQVESRSRNNENRVLELQRRLSETERIRRDLEGKVRLFCNAISDMIRFKKRLSQLSVSQVVVVV